MGAARCGVVPRGRKKEIFFYTIECSLYCRVPYIAVDSTSLDGWNAKLREAMPPSAREAGGSIQLANVACCVQAFEWPHKDLPLCLMGGFDIVGFLSPSGVFPAAKRVDFEPIHELDHVCDNAAKVSELWSHYRARETRLVARVRQESL